MRKFKLDPSRGVKLNSEVIPPPNMTDHPLPFNWGYHQNPTVKFVTNHSTGEQSLINSSAPAKLGTIYLPGDCETVPTEPENQPPDDPVLKNLIECLQAALEERPIWTRRAIANHIGPVPGVYLLKPAVQYIGYQFRGGPWRDCIIKFGLDPRDNPKYRIYQSLFFKIFDEADKAPGQPWHDIRAEYTKKAHGDTLSRSSHLFDGKSVSLDGKIWQLCDITDPLLKRMISEGAVSERCDVVNDGWYCNGTMAKIKAVMRTKITAIRLGYELVDEEFAKTLAFPDKVEGKVKITAPRPGFQINGQNQAFTAGGELERRRKRKVRAKILALDPRKGKTPVKKNEFTTRVYKSPYESMQTASETATEPATPIGEMGGNMDSETATGDGDGVEGDEGEDEDGDDVDMLDDSGNGDSESESGHDDEEEDPEEVDTPNRDVE